MAKRGPSAAVLNYGITNQAGHIDPAFDIKDKYYDAFTGRWQESQTIQELSQQRQTDFLTFMEQLIVDYPEMKASNFRSTLNYKWAEVVTEANAALDSYGSRTKGPLGALSRIGRKTGEYSEPIVTVLESTLPCGEYTSIICGGIILIFKAFKIVSEFRQKILEALGESPALLETVARLMANHPDKVGLRARAAELYIALLSTTQGMAQWLKKHPMRRIEALFKQEGYEQYLRDKISNLQQCTSRMRAEAELCDQERLRDIFRLVNLIGAETATIVSQNTHLMIQGGETYASVQNVEDGVIAIRKAQDKQMEYARRQEDGFTNIQSDVRLEFGRLGDVQGSMQRVDDHVVDVRTDIEQLGVAQMRLATQAQRQVDELRNEVSAPINRMVGMLECLEKGMELERQQWKTRIENLEAEVNSKPSQPDYASSITANDVCEMLGNWSEHNAELASYYANVGSDAGPDIATAIIESPGFCGWYASMQSYMLIVTYDLIDETVQPGSFVTAALYQQLAGARSAIRLTHFCMQQSPYDKMDAAANLLANFISTLLASLDIDMSQWTSFERISMQMSSLREHNLNYLCDLFKYLVMRASGVTIFCLIDDLKSLEGATDIRSVGKVVALLDELVGMCSRRGRVIFKVVLMTPRRDTELWQFILDESCVWLEV
ncbi:hypothetical protein LTR97_007497 [Elasticomyces elasticus]|uniref:Uncharacterized protein n=1 Tax=Elasticomyces elasticus TaxID=574655 RepID=A0AAN8A259_9PEZI|nr:hypothetical protein LTR97_007497 [Elasticomyces elasticus]